MMSLAGFLPRLIYSAAAEVCVPGCNPLLAAAQTPALGLIAPWQAGPGLASSVNDAPRGHSSTLGRECSSRFASVSLSSREQPPL